MADIIDIKDISKKKLDSELQLNTDRVAKAILGLESDIPIK